jgi:hypothetical protein
LTLSFEEIKVDNKVISPRLRSSGGRKLRQPSPAVQDLHGQ